MMREEIAIKRGMLSDLCSICHENFQQGEEERILTCSHFFHSKCIALFEWHACRRKKGHLLDGGYTCPFCRAPYYETKRTSVGVVIHLNSCSLKIGALVRGWLARKEIYHRYRKDLIGPNSALAQRFRKYIGKEVEHISNTLLQKIDVDYMYMERIIYESDQSIATSRDIFSEILVRS